MHRKDADIRNGILCGKGSASFARTARFTAHFCASLRAKRSDRHAGDDFLDGLVQALFACAEHGLLVSADHGSNRSRRVYRSVAFGDGVDVVDRVY